MRSFISLYINGRSHQVTGEQAFLSLSDFLRYEQQATGTKVVCAEGDCGACTVLLGKPTDKVLDYQAVNACIQYMYQLDGAHIITVEGLKQGDTLHPVQEAMVEHHGAQCGYCTPGFVMAMCGLFNEQTEPLGCSAVKGVLTGNLCRCTGYEPIIRAGLNVDMEALLPLNKQYPPGEMLKSLQLAQSEPVLVEHTERVFFKPVTVESAVAFKAKHPGTTVISGGTDVHVVCNKRGLEPSAVLSTAHLPGLSDLKIQTVAGQETLIVGARVTLSALEAFMEERLPELSAMLEVFGSPQIKNAGTMAGNIANGSPIGDTLPFLMVLDAEVELTGLQGARRVNMNQLYTGYRAVAMNPDELITGIFIPLPAATEHFKLYKVSKRKHLDISTFSAAIRMQVSEGRIQTARLAYGGVGPVVLRLKETETFLTGKPFTETTFAEAGKLARQEVTPISDVRGSRDFRLQLSENILMKFYLEATDAHEAWEAAYA